MNATRQRIATVLCWLPALILLSVVARIETAGFCAGAAVGLIVLVVTLPWRVRKGKDGLR